MIYKRNYEVFVSLIQFHNGKIRECVVANEDGSYTIFIESTLSRMEQIEAYNHAMFHITHNDFEKECATVIEKEAHEKTHPA